MIKTLIYLDTDLASRIALRYACGLAKMTEMHLQAIHVEASEDQGRPPGAGWVRQTWEKGLLDTSRGEISRLINAEMASFPARGGLRVAVGNREEEILREMGKETYDLFMEGVLFSFDAGAFHQKIRSRLYSQTPCPIIVVKNLVTPKRVVLLLEDHRDFRPLISTFLKVFEGADVQVDLLCLRFQEASRTGIERKKEDGSVLEQGEPDRVAGAAKEMLAAGGWFSEQIRTAQDTPTQIADALNEYGLVISCLPRPMRKRSPLLELLSRVPSAVLLCKQ